MDKIPKDLKRWLKENNHYSEFIRLLKVCHYRIDDLAYKNKTINIDGTVQEDYTIKSWFNDSIENKCVFVYDKFSDIRCGKALRYSDFLDSLKLNWK